GSSDDSDYVARGMAIHRKDREIVTPGDKAGAPLLVVFVLRGKHIGVGEQSYSDQEGKQANRGHSFSVMFQDGPEKRREGNANTERHQAAQPLAFAGSANGDSFFFAHQFQG